MCQSKADGGQRCAAHTRPPYLAALADLESNGTAANLWSAVEAIYAHATTPSGLDEVRADADQTQGRLRGLMQDAAERGAAEQTRRAELPAAVAKAATTVAQAHAATGSVALRINTDYPFPQANSLTKVATVVDAVSGRADTDESIAAALGVVQRQGAYYASAAAYLGLIAEHGRSPRCWALTPQGAMFLDAEPEDRSRMLSDLVAQIPASSAALDEDDESISDAVLASTSLSTTTATRRSATVKGWVHTLTGDTVLDELTLEHDQTRGRIPEAAKLAAAARTRLRAAAHAPSRPTVTCERCFIVIAPSGACGC